MNNPTNSYFNDDQRLARDIKSALNETQGYWFLEEQSCIPLAVVSLVLKCRSPLSYDVSGFETSADSL